MKLEIYDDTTPEPEQVVRLRLMRGIKGSVTVVAVSDDGERLPRSTILSLAPGGRITLAVRVNTDFGFDLNSEGCVKTN